MLEKEKKDQQSGFSVMSTEELYEINGGEQMLEQTKASLKVGGGIPSQGPSISTSIK